MRKFRHAEPRDRTPGTGQRAHQRMMFLENRDDSH
jgi:hypothetical protein